MSAEDIQRVTPAFTTGGGGFSFEDRAGTWMLTAMLAGEAPLGQNIGVPGALEFQQKLPPTPLDDMVVRGTGPGVAPTWWASIKSFDVLSTGLADFVSAAWNHTLSEQFDFGRDYLGFICGQATDDDWTSVRELIETARNDTPERLAGRMVVPGNFNATDRQLWQAFKCPEDLANQHGVDIETSPALALSRLVPLWLDFRSADSSAEMQARAWCEAALLPGNAGRSADLYNAALELVARTRPSGGSITWARAQRELGRDFPLARRADAAPDWAILEQHTNERLATVQDMLANGLHLPRATARAQLAEVENDSFIYLTGPSGCGKTALAKGWLTDAAGRLWLTPRDLENGLLEFGSRLNLRLPLADVLQLGETPVRVVIDGLDRSYDPHAHAAAAALAGLASASGGGLQILVTSQSFALGRVAQLIQKANGPHPSTAVIGDLDDDDISITLEERPELYRLVFQGSLREVLRRPKLLQVVFQTLGEADDAALAQVRDEAAVADLWWTRLALGNSQARAPRGEFLRGLASWTADQLAEGLPAGQLGAAGLDAYAGVVDDLRGEEILAPEEDTYSFGHELFADWARFKTLGTWPDSQTTMSQQQGRPPWHRAIRLFALRTLREDGVERWAEQHNALREAGHEIAADLYLDAPLFAAEAEDHLRALWATLVERDRSLLARMLNRFMLSGSVPDPRAALLTEGGDHQLQTMMAATWRLPTWVLWPPVLRALAAEAADAVAAAPLPVAALAELWLRVAPDGYPGHRDAAQLGFAAGEFAAGARQAGVHLDDDQRDKLWTAFLAAGSEMPGEVLGIALEAFRNDVGETQE